MSEFEHINFEEIIEAEVGIHQGADPRAPIGYAEAREIMKAAIRTDREGRTKEVRIRELEEVVEGMLYEVKRTISPELREKAEKALNKK